MSTKSIDSIAREIVDPDAWRSQHDELLSAEKEHTRASDRLAAERRRMPWMLVDKDYRFIGAEGELGLGDLFEGRRQLIVYHHMLKPSDPSPCAGCGMVGDQIPRLVHLHQRDTTLAFVARAPLQEIQAFKERIGWEVPWYESTEEFGVDFDVPQFFGLNVFFRGSDDQSIYRTYFTTARGVEALGTVWTLLDLTPLGRQEEWEDLPEGSPRTSMYHWWRLNDEYGSG